MTSYRRKHISGIFLVLLSFIFLFVLSCSGKGKVPKGILPPEKMEEVMWDMVSAGEFLTGYVVNKGDSVNRYMESAKVYGKVLQFHKISQEQFDKSYLYYRLHPELMSVMVDSLSKRHIDAEDNVPPPVQPPVATDKETQDTVRNLDSFTRKMMDTLKTRRDSLRKKMKKFKAVP